MTCDRSVVFSGYSGFLDHKTDRHDITEILLKVALNTIKQTNKLSGIRTRNIRVIGSDCIGSCKSNYHTITTTTSPLSTCWCIIRLVLLLWRWFENNKWVTAYFANGPGHRKAKINPIDTSTRRFIMSCPVVNNHSLNRSITWPPLSYYNAIVKLVIFRGSIFLEYYYLYDGIIIRKWWPGYASRWIKWEWQTI